MTRCKVGDLAIVIQAPKGASIGVGAIVKILALDGYAELWTPSGKVATDSEVWRVEFRGVKTDPVSGFPWGVPDSELRPIRDPGEDAQDETLLWKPVPSTVKETA